MNAHLHGGKWSEEEELYAAALIEAFKAGVLPPEDIDEVSRGQCACYGWWYRVDELGCGINADIIAVQLRLLAYSPLSPSGHKLAEVSRQETYVQSQESEQGRLRRGWW